MPRLRQILKPIGKLLAITLLSASSPLTHADTLTPHGMFIIKDKTCQRPQLRKEYEDKIDVLGCLHEGLSVFREGRLFGFMDKYGKVIIPPIYPSADDFSEGVARVKVAQGKYQFIDKYNHVVLKDLPYQIVDSFSDGLAKVQNITNPDWIEKNEEIKREIGFIDHTSRLKIPLIYEEADNFKHGLSVVQKNGKQGVIDTHGKTVIRLKYDTVFIEDTNLFSVGKNKEQPTPNHRLVNEEWAFIDRHERFITPYYDSASTFAGGLSSVRYEGKYGYIDRKGNIIVPFIYDSVGYSMDEKKLILRLGKQRIVIDNPMVRK